MVVITYYMHFYFISFILISIEKYDCSLFSHTRSCCVVSEQPGVFQREGRGCGRCLGVRGGNNYLRVMTHGKQHELRPELKYVHGSLLEREGYIQLFTGTPMNSLAQQELPGRGAESCLPLKSGFSPVLSPLLCLPPRITFPNTPW